ncbi:MAG: HNH endonuclease signature motif containing protein [Candidatus Eremiobacteraeota bacterium]|nr:HNH endonuclease signature motif containing protein [Candidatus Eremiobacteraeota bacterium]
MGDIDFLLLPEPYEVEEDGIHRYDHLVKVDIDAFLTEAERLVECLAFSSFDREEKASQIDSDLCRAVRSRMALDLVLGRLLEILKQKGVDHLGYRSLETFAVEHLSLSGRTASELIHNYELLSRLPRTCEAYLQGRVSKSALRPLSRVINPENEEEWLEKAGRLPVRALEKEAKEALASQAVEETSADLVPDSDKKNGMMMRFRVSPALALTWDFALSYFRDKEHYSGPQAGFVEALLSNWMASGKLSERGVGTVPVPLDDRGSLPVFYRVPLSRWRRNVEPMPSDGEQHSCEEQSCCDRHSSRERRSFRRRRGYMQSASDLESHDPWKYPWSIFFPSWLEEVTEVTGREVRVLARRLIKAAWMRQRLEVGIGMLLRAMDMRQLYRVFGYDSVEEYGADKCGFSKAQIYRFIRLAKDFHRHSLTEEAFKSGIITREQARLILPIVNENNEDEWIAYAASVPVITLREEAQRCARIVEYDCLVLHKYRLLPSFRYITDERFAELPEEVRECIRTGSWYEGPSLRPSWPLAENDGESAVSRDKRLEEPWKYFEDVDELVAYEAAMKESRKTVLCAADGSQAFTMEKGGIALRAPQDDLKSSPCSCAGAACQADGEVHRQTRVACTIPHGENPEEIFLMDLIRGSAASAAGGIATGGCTIAIRFFLPEDLYNLWNTAATAFLRLAAQSEESAANESGASESAALDSAAIDLATPPWEERFLASLLADYLTAEKVFHKAARHHDILKRDRFRCQVPGCHCRHNLEVHHIIRRSQGGTDDPRNLITLCKAHHIHILHTLRALVLKGQAPHNLTFTFGSRPGCEPFLVYESGVKKRGLCFILPRGPAGRIC